MMELEKMGKYAFEVGMYRPPSEGGSSSLLLRFTRNCPWNQCAFCGMYKHEKFSLRSLEEIQGDIDSIAGLVRDMQSLSLALGHAGRISRDVILAMIEKEPELNTSHGFAMVINWLSSGGKTAFLQDGNSLMMDSGKLMEALRHLRSTFPSLERCTTYARSKTLSRKPLEELTGIRQAGLDRLHVGLETGDETLLKKIKKGVTAQEHIEGGRKAIKAGFQLSEYWMPGLGGREDWQNHARNTARVLNDINPHYIRSRPFSPWLDTPIHEECEKGTLTLLSARERLIELKLMIETLDVTSRVCFDHAGNDWVNRNGRLLFSHSYEGYKFPEEKTRVLNLISEGIEIQ
ncbi:MAG: radical SAM protein [Desulfobacterales bacterium]|nr:radical SAM protein [Desulfobacterales bacterium]